VHSKSQVFRVNISLPSLLLLDDHSQTLAISIPETRPFTPTSLPSHIPLSNLSDPEAIGMLAVASIASSKLEGVPAGACVYIYHSFPSYLAYL